MTWAELFERATDYDVTESDLSAALRERRDD